MSVTVVTRRENTLMPDGERKTYPNATEYTVHEGFLHVERLTSTGMADNVATYAPGEWLRVFVDDEEK
jgi:hypothetical protein